MCFTVLFNTTKFIPFVMLFSSNMAYAQQSGNEISVTTYVRMDKYPAFTYASGPTVSYSVQMKGISPGLYIDYTKSFSKHFHATARLGYYRSTVNKIEQRSNTGITSASRPTNLQLLPGVFFGFSSDRYAYNNICVGAGAGKDFLLKENIQVRAGVFINQYITSSQSYHIDYDHPDNQVENPYKNTKTKYAGFDAGLQCSIIKNIGRCRFGPAILLPLYSLWKTDAVFAYETNTGSRSKWLHTVGAGFSLCYPLTTKKQ